MIKDKKEDAPHSETRPGIKFQENRFHSQKDTKKGPKNCEGPQIIRSLLGWEDPAIMIKCQDQEDLLSAQNWTDQEDHRTIHNLL